MTSHLRMALIEAQDLSSVRSWRSSSMSSPQQQQLTFSNRCSSLTPATAAYLRRIGAWDLLARDRVQPFAGMRVWDGVSGARIEFDLPESWPEPVEEDRADEGQAMAYMTENVNLTSALLTRLDTLGGVAVFDGAKVEEIVFDAEIDGAHHVESAATARDPADAGPDLSEWPVVRISKGGRRLWARLLVGADGANSPVRAFAGIESRGWDYGRHGVVATLRLGSSEAAEVGSSRPQHRLAYQRFLPTGPVALLPLPDGHASLVWTTTPAHAARLKALSPTDFVAMVNAAFRLSTVDLQYMLSISSGQVEELAWRLEHTSTLERDADLIPPAVSSVQEGSVASFPLRLRHADSYVSERIALVGDAAHTIHPLAGQGLNQGQADVASLERALAYAITHGIDIGSLAALEPYGAERYAANHIVMGVCDKLHWLYSAGGGPVVGLRSVGLSAVNAMTPVKNFLMRRASASGAGLW